MGEPFRVEPALPVHLMKTYAISAPRTTHWRPATCEEAACPHYLLGWVTIVAADSPQADYIRAGSGRGFTEQRTPDGLAEFTFEPGQACFGASQHRVPNGRPERFIERGGDWRGNPQRQHRELRADDWVDSFANNMISVKEMQERG